MLLTACTTIGTQTVLNREAAFSAVPADQVEVFLLETEVGRQYEEIGLIVAYAKIRITNIFGLDGMIGLLSLRKPTGDMRRYGVYDALRRKAGELGANAVIITSFDVVEYNYSMSGVAIRVRKP